MTNMTEPAELLDFKRQKDVYKDTIKISLCICVVLSWDEPPFTVINHHNSYKNLT